MAGDGAKAVRMGDIAQRVGVSRTAVSFVLNNRDDTSVSPATRERILRAAEELGYRPHAAARALAAQRSGLVGLVTEIVTSPFGMETVKGAQDRSWQDGKFLLIAATEGKPELEQMAIEKLLEQRVEGLIYASGFHREVTLPPIALDVPTVLVHCFDAQGRLPSIVPDEEEGGHSATRRLIEAGHRRIAFINLERDTVAAQGRLAGYRRALIEAGVVPEDELVTSVDSSADGGYVAACALLDLTDRPTALFCGTDRIAMGAYDAIKERGLSIPADVAVVGFDNQELIAAYLRPKLTTVALPFHEMGTRGVEMLGAALAAGQPIAAEQVTVGCPLVERSSV
jgi:LacI family transcriptional regulator